MPEAPPLNPGSMPPESMGTDSRILPPGDADIANTFEPMSMMDTHLDIENDAGLKQETDNPGEVVDLQDVPGGREYLASYEVISERQTSVFERYLGQEDRDFYESGVGENLKNLNDLSGEATELIDFPDKVRERQDEVVSDIAETHRDYIMTKVDSFIGSAINISSSRDEIEGALSEIGQLRGAIDRTDMTKRQTAELAGLSKGRRIFTRKSAIRGLLKARAEELERNLLDRADEIDGSSSTDPRLTRPSISLYLRDSAATTCRASIVDHNKGVMSKSVDVSDEDMFISPGQSFLGYAIQRRLGHVSDSDILEDAKKSLGSSLDRDVERVSESFVDTRLKKLFGSINSIVSDGSMAGLQASNLFLNDANVMNRLEQAFQNTSVRSFRDHIISTAHSALGTFQRSVLVANTTLVTYTGFLDHVRQSGLSGKEIHGKTTTNDTGESNGIHITQVDGAVNSFDYNMYPYGGMPNQEDRSPGASVFTIGDLIAAGGDTLEMNMAPGTNGQSRIVDLVPTSSGVKCSRAQLPNTLGVLVSAPSPDDLKREVENASRTIRNGEQGSSSGLVVPIAAPKENEFSGEPLDRGAGFSYGAKAKYVVIEQYQ